METNTQNNLVPNAIVAFQEFNAASKARENERLVKVCYRTDSKTKAKPLPSVCLSIPQINTEELKASIDKFLPLFLISIQEQQDKIARKLYEAGNSSISTTQLSLNAVAEFLEESIYESRLTKDLIEEWFDTIVCAKLSEVLKIKHADTGISEAKLKTVIEEYKTKFSALAGGRTNYETPIVNALLRVFELIEDNEDTLTIRLFTRLSDMLTKQKKTEESLLLL